MEAQERRCPFRVEGLPTLTSNGKQKKTQMELKIRRELHLKVKFSSRPNTIDLELGRG
jgi:hypothetical protein